MSSFHHSVRLHKSKIHIEADAHHTQILTWAWKLRCPFVGLGRTFEHPWQHCPRAKRGKEEEGGDERERMPPGAWLGCSRSSRAASLCGKARRERRDEWNGWMETVSHCLDGSSACHFHLLPAHKSQGHTNKSEQVHILHPFFTSTSNHCPSSFTFKLYFVGILNVVMASDLLLGSVLPCFPLMNKCDCKHVSSKRACSRSTQTSEILWTFPLQPFAWVPPRNFSRIFLKYSLIPNLQVSQDAAWLTIWRVVWIALCVLIKNDVAKAKWRKPREKSWYHRPLHASTNLHLRCPPVGGKMHSFELPTATLKLLMNGPKGLSFL